MAISRPIRFDGTPEQRQINYATHNFVTFNGEDYNCLDCDCKPGHVAADYPCGQEPPRETVGS